MDMVFDNLISSLLFTPDYLPDVLQWFKKQPKENGHISKACMEKILCVINYPCWKRFLQATEGPCELSQEDLTAAEYELLIKTGIAQLQSVKMIGSESKSYNLSLTNEAKTVFDTFDKEQFKRDKLRSSAVHLVAVAAVNAYGIIEGRQFTDLFNGYMEQPAQNSGLPFGAVSEPLTPDELNDILAPYTELNIDVLLVDGYLVNRMLYNGSDSDISAFLLNVSADIEYQFGIEALLAYANPEYFEPTPQIVGFLERAKEKFSGIAAGDFYMISLLFAPCYLLEWPQMIEISLCPAMKELSRKEQEEMAELFVDAVRSARSWRYKGFSENEVSPDGEGRGEEVREFLRVLGEC